MAPTKRKHNYKPTATIGPDGAPQSSVYRGVSLHKGTMKYRATIKIKGAKIALGSYDDEIEAAKAFDRAALRYRGHKADVNFPQESRPAPKRQKTDELPSIKPKMKADIEPRTGLRSKACKLIIKSEASNEEELQGPDSNTGSNETNIEINKEPTIGLMYSPFKAAANLPPPRKGEHAQQTKKVAEIEGSDSFHKAFSCEHSDTADSKAPSGQQDWKNLSHTESHGLNVLQSRFQLYRFDSSATSTSAKVNQLEDLEMTSWHPSRQLEMGRPSRQYEAGHFHRQCSAPIDNEGHSKDFRQLLMSRAYANQRRDSDQSQESSRVHWSEWPVHRQIVPVNFEDEERGEQRRAWWKLQLQLTQEQQFLRNLS